ncbi:MAG: cation-translocating P-type ATPase [Oscillospiraceae bacterium]|jgi:Ca2+-transporting ATPase|nr:cation-translocating P-type ATPase [Oscillospiraceae bacterium]
MGVERVLEHKSAVVKKELGLSSAKAKQKLREEGPNMLKQSKKVSAPKIFFAQFKDFLTAILIVSTLISFALGDTTEAIAILAIVIVNALLGFFQEYRTEKTIDALKNMAAPHSNVLRDGAVVNIASSEIVTEDVFLVEAGDKVPADAAILESYGLHVDESILTGESVSVEKHEKGQGKAGRLFMGTVVTKGRAKALTTATGMHTEMGKIAGMLDSIEEPETPLQKRLRQLGKYIAVGCLLICAVVSVTGILKGEDVLDMFIMGVSLAVAAVPEGLSAIVTIALALAVGRMVKRQSLIRKLHAVETLGCSSIVCSDKTGTLTENKMTVKKIITYDTEALLEGNGFDTFGSFLTGSHKIDPLKDPAMKYALTGGCVCNNAALPERRRELFSKNKAKPAQSGDATEIALLVAGAKAGIKREFLQQYEKLDEIPFDSDRKCMSVIAANAEGRLLFTKGAPDIVLEKCTKVYTKNGIKELTSGMKAAVLRQNDMMASEALRVICVAFKRNPEGAKSNMERELIFLGLIGMLDPPRKESYGAVRVCKQAGIRPVMITGDHKVTATAIAEDLKIYSPGDNVLTGKEIDAMTERELMEKVQKTTVFARVSPRHKLQIVRAYKQLGHVVAMTGDGVNDAPAIKEADIGVSMGISGTDVAKEAADVILLDDNFATLVAAIEEGRMIYQNIRKFIRYLLSCNVGEVLTMFVGMLVGLPVVLLPIQILWINLVTDGLPAIALGLDPADGDVMEEPPRHSNEGVFAHGLMTKIIFRGIVIAACTLLVFVRLQAFGLETARTGAFFTLVITQLFHVFECKSEKKTILDIHYFNNLYLFGAAMISFFMIFAVIYVPSLQPIFNTVALNSQHLSIIFMITLSGIFLNLVVLTVKNKLGERKRQAKKSAGAIRRQDVS